MDETKASAKDGKFYSWQLINAFLQIENSQMAITGCNLGMIGPSFVYDKLYQEAQSRWLKSPEVLFILQNHENRPIEQEAPERPISGSLFLFNRRVLKFFRKDGHIWKKKKDGRAIDEAHERLKVGNADVLNCYYARGEKNPYFQRRIYWILNPAYDHIVLVHYREVTEGRSLPPTVSQQPQEKLFSRNGSSSVNNIQFKGASSATSEIYDSYQTYCGNMSGEVNSMHAGKSLDTDWLHVSKFSANSDPSSQPVINQALRDLEEQLSLDSSDDNVLGEMFSAYTNEYTKLDDPALLDIEIGVNGKDKGLSLVLNHDVKLKSCPWTDMLEVSSRSTGLCTPGKAASSMTLAYGPEHSCYTTSAIETYHCIGKEFKHGSVLQQFSSEKNIIDSPFDQLEQISWRWPGHAGNNSEHMTDGSDINSQLLAAGRFLLGSDGLWLPNSVTNLADSELCNTPFTTFVGPNFNVVSVRKENGINCMGTNIFDKNNAYSSGLLGVCSDQDQHGTSLAPESCLSVAQKPLFRIREISPEWSFSFESTKVIITGDFCCDPSAYSWAVMFGNVEVPVEIVQEGVLRCLAPEHSIGKVILSITSGNSESCSELREFEFRTKSASSSFEFLHHVNATKNSEELSLLAKFVHALLCRSTDLSALNGAGPRESEHQRKFEAADEHWLVNEHQTDISSGTIGGILLELIKDKFQQWLLSKTNVKENRNCLLSKEEQHIIHMISGLGYEWALNPILDVGVGINFRDANGMTALHWAARFGREKMAAALLAAGAFAGAVTDPTPQDPVGKTAGAIASASGHKGLAGYLSEADLTSHLSSIAMNECNVSKALTVMEDEKAVESISERNALLQVGETEEEISLKDSLAAVRNAAQAASRIQAAFRAHSFRKRNEIAAMNPDESGLTLEDIYRITSSSKLHRELHSYQYQKFDKAALSIQKKYRGWKGRKDFLTLRQHVVKIQAHVRAHQERRKKYREFLWMVGALEKLVLRWRRKGVGLRGFWLESDLADEGEKDEEDIVKVFRKQKVDAAIEQALSRVLSMVESPIARQQYRRMLQIYCELKVGEGRSVEETM